LAAFFGFARLAAVFFLAFAFAFRFGLAFAIPDA